jgi:hypothetical protein
LVLIWLPDANIESSNMSHLWSPVGESYVP